MVLLKKKISGFAWPLDNPTTIFDRGQFSLQTSGSFDNKRFEGNGFVTIVMQPVAVETTFSAVVIVEAVKHGIGQVLLRRNAEMADGTVPRGIGTRGTNGGPQRGRGTNVTTDLDLQAHRGTTDGVMIAYIDRELIIKFKTGWDDDFSNF